MCVVVASPGTRVALLDGVGVVQAGLPHHASSFQVALQEFGVGTATEAEADVALWRPGCLEIHEGHVALPALREFEGLHLAGVPKPEGASTSVEVAEGAVVLRDRLAQAPQLE